MKKTSFIQLGLVTAALAYGISSMYVGVVDNQVQDDYNPVVVVNELPQVAQAIDDLKEELNNGVKDAKYLKEVKNIDVKEDVKMFTSMLIELEVVTTYKVINYLNANASGLSNVQKMQESPLKTHLGKITELNSKVENSLKEHNRYNQKIEEMKNYQLATIDGQRDWVVEVNKLIQKIKTKEKIEEMNKDLHQVNQEIKPIVDEVKKLESKDKKTLDMKKIVSLIKEQKQMAQSSSTNQTKLKI